MVFTFLYKYSVGILDSIKLLKFSLKLLDEYVFYIAIFTIIMISYFIIKPVIIWFITLKSIRLLSFLLSSFLVSTFVLIAKITIRELDHLLINLLQVTLDCLALFGFGLLLTYVLQEIFKKGET